LLAQSSRLRHEAELLQVADGRPFFVADARDGAAYFVLRVCAKPGAFAEQRIAEFWDFIEFTELDARNDLCDCGGVK
jgi:hypothetical protein